MDCGFVRFSKWSDLITLFLKYISQIVISVNKVS